MCGNTGFGKDLFCLWYKKNLLSNSVAWFSLCDILKSVTVLIAPWIRHPDPQLVLLSSPSPSRPDHSVQLTTLPSHCLWTYLWDVFPTPKGSRGSSSVYASGDGICDAATHWVTPSLCLQGSWIASVSFVPLAHKHPSLVLNEGCTEVFEASGPMILRRTKSPANVLSGSCASSFGFEFWDVQ